MIHKEGYVSIGLVLGVFTAILIIMNWLVPGVPYIFPLVYAAFAFFMIVVLQFFRNPKRHTVINENHIICPADGKVVVIETLPSYEGFEGECVQISVFMSPINVHVNRYPISGKILSAEYFPGLFLVAWHPKSSTDNERTAIMLQAENGHKLLVKQIAGALARRIVWYAKPNETCKQGEELGFIKFGSRVDLIIPKAAIKKINVSLNEVVKGGETVLVEW